MKSKFTAIFWVIAVILGVFLISQLSDTSSTSSSSYLPASNENENEYDQEETSFSYEEAISDYWDDIKTYVSGSETIEACSDSSGNCYDVDADLSDGCVDQIHFDNGGYLDFSYACFDESGSADDTDDEGNGWTFSIDMDSSIITDAVDSWASDSNYNIE